jgi:hypothetical protein
METKTAIRRHRLQKPVKQTPVEITKISDSKEVIDLINHFMCEARKELRKRERLTVKGMLHKHDCERITIFSDNFSLTIDFTEGGTL